MATKGIEIPLSINPAKLIRGLRITERGFDDLQDEITDVSQAGDRMERDLEDAFRDTARNADRYGRDTGRNFTDGVEDGQSTVGQVGAEFGEEFTQSWGEAIRGGNPGEAISETITNSGQLLSVLGPAGAIAGLGIAAAGGFITNFITSAREDSERLTEVAGAFFDGLESGEGSFLERGREAYRAFVRGYTEESAIGDTLAANLDVGSALEAWEEIARIAGETGLDATTVTEAILGQAGAQREVKAAVDENNEAQDRTLDLLGQSFDKLDGSRQQYEELAEGHRGRGRCPGRPGD